MDYVVAVRSPPPCFIRLFHATFQCFAVALLASCSVSLCAADADAEPQDYAGRRRLVVRKRKRPVGLAPNVQSFQPYGLPGMPILIRKLFNLNVTIWSSFQTFVTVVPCSVEAAAHSPHSVRGHRSPVASVPKDRVSLASRPGWSLRPCRCMRRSLDKRLEITPN